MSPLYCVAHSSSLEMDPSSPSGGFCFETNSCSPIGDNLSLSAKMSSGRCLASDERQTDNTLEESVRFGFVLSENGLSGYCRQSPSLSEGPSTFQQSYIEAELRAPPNPAALSFLYLAPLAPKKRYMRRRPVRQPPKEHLCHKKY